MMNSLLTQIDRQIDRQIEQLARIHALCLRIMGPRAKSRRRGVTLLELILALALSVLVLAVVSMAINTHLKSLSSGRSQVEEAQIARVVLKMIATDLRSAVKSEPADFSVMKEMAEKAAQKAEQGTNAASGGDSNDRSSPSPGNSGSPGGSSSPTGGSTSGQEAGGSTVSGDSFGDGDLSALDEEMEDDSEQELALSESVASSSEPGLYGNQYELQLDVSRLPRRDEFQTIQQSFQDLGLAETPSDVKTVAYYIRREQSAFSTGAGVAGSEQRFLEKSAGIGLVRREIDRSVTQWALENNDAQSLNLSGDLIAPEVLHLEFRYFDGLEWLTEWDSEEDKGLPIAVEIILIVGSADQAEAFSSTGFSTIDTSQLYAQDHVYRLIVRLPNAPLAPNGEEETSDAEGLAP